MSELQSQTIRQHCKALRMPTIGGQFDRSGVSAAQLRGLAEGEYVAKAEPVLLIGEAGTGKTHLATGLCVAACRQRRRVRFTSRRRRRRPGWRRRLAAGGPAGLGRGRGGALPCTSPCDGTLSLD